jgi:hypothetical protein
MPSAPRAPIDPYSELALKIRPAVRGSTAAIMYGWSDHHGPEAFSGGRGDLRDRVQPLG